VGRNYVGGEVGEGKRRKQERYRSTETSKVCRSFRVLVLIHYRSENPLCQQNLPKDLLQQRAWGVGSWDIIKGLLPIPPNGNRGPLYSKESRRGEGFPAKIMEKTVKNAASYKG